MGRLSPKTMVNIYSILYYTFYIFIFFITCQPGIKWNVKIKRIWVSVIEQTMYFRLKCTTTVIVSLPFSHFSALCVFCQWWHQGDWQVWFEMICLSCWRFRPSFSYLLIHSSPFLNRWLVYFLGIYYNIVFRAFALWCFRIGALFKHKKKVSKLLNLHKTPQLLTIAAWSFWLTSLRFVTWIFSIENSTIKDKPLVVFFFLPAPVDLSIPSLSLFTLTSSFPILGSPFPALMDFQARPSTTRRTTIQHQGYC